MKFLSTAIIGSLYAAMVIAVAVPLTGNNVEETELKSNERVIGAPVIDVVVGARNKDDVIGGGSLGSLGGILGGLGGL
ncbi:hypothetical protein F5887DRAFT_955827 [Amanita rubescens]|nr:hypothetical protein F5887DRAFT_955827 [Amanita rubescens]